MDTIYEGHGIRFRYPAWWEVSVQEDDECALITVDSPETSSWSVSLFFDGPPPEAVVNSAVEAFREEYDEVDVYSSDASAGERLERGPRRRLCLSRADQQRLSALLSNRAFHRLVLYQGFDGELETTRPLLEAITNSLKLDGEEENDSE